MNCVGRGRPVGGVPAEAVVGHRQPTDLGNDVLAAGDLGDVGLPLLEDLFSLALVGPDTERGAEVIEHHRGAGHVAGEVEEVLVLVVVVPRVVGEAALPQTGHTRPERRVGVQPSGRPTRDRQHLGMQRVRAGIANSHGTDRGLLRRGRRARHRGSLRRVDRRGRRCHPSPADRSVRPRRRRTPSRRPGRTCRRPSDRRQRRIRRTPCRPRCARRPGRLRGRRGHRASNRRRGHRWWCGSMIGASASTTGSTTKSSQSGEAGSGRGSASHVDVQPSSADLRFAIVIWHAFSRLSRRPSILPG